MLKLHDFCNRALQKIRGVLLAQSAALTAQSQYQLDRDAAAMETGTAKMGTKPTPVGTYQN